MAPDGQTGEMREVVELHITPQVVDAQASSAQSFLTLWLACTSWHRATNDVSCAHNQKFTRVYPPPTAVRLFLRMVLRMTCRSGLRRCGKNHRTQNIFRAILLLSRPCSALHSQGL